MKKIQLKVYIPDELRDKLYDYVKAKYAKIHGGLSIEVQNAIAHWLNEQALAAHTKTHINPGLPRAQMKIDAIIKWLRDRGFTNQFTVRDWEKACVDTVGSDPRTVQKYLRLAEKLHRVKFYAGNVWEIV